MGITNNVSVIANCFQKIYCQFPISFIIWGIWGYFIVIVERNKTGDVIELPGIPNIVCKHLESITKYS